MIGSPASWTRDVITIDHIIDYVVYYTRDAISSTRMQERQFEGAAKESGGEHLQ